MDNASTTTTRPPRRNVIATGLRGRVAVLATLAAVLATTGAAAVGAPAAGAAMLSTKSSNWAGYAARRTGVAFKRVSATWTVPKVDCTSPTNSYSANWVGLGGYAANSQALEQLGTESDCSGNGTATYSTWFEVVPAASSSAKLAIQPGDSVFASATVNGHLVTLTLANLTRGTKATKSVRAATVDLSSAEWIVEAPGVCLGESEASCRQSALANFGTTNFTSARATTTAGHAGSILDSAWNAIGISLSPQQQVTPRGPGGGWVPGGGWSPGAAGTGTDTGTATPVQDVSSSGSASPAGLSPDGTAFSVNYAP
ncbi:MAG TPA: G1 family glutamic endopeptidase [Baekduia sp.]